MNKQTLFVLFFFFGLAAQAQRLPVTVPATPAATPGDVIQRGASGWQLISVEDLAAQIGVNPDVVQKTTLANLRAVTAPAAGSVYYLTDPGKEGIFKYDSADASSIDDTGTVVVAGSARFKRVIGTFVRPEWWDAKRDGTTDDGNRLQSMFNYVSGTDRQFTIVLSPGTYLINTTVDLPGQIDAANVTKIEGFGATLKTTAAIPIFRRVPPDQSTAMVWISGYRYDIEGITFVGTQTTGQKALALGAVFSWNIHNNEFRSLDTAISFNFAIDCKVINNKFTQNKSVCIKGFSGAGIWSGATESNSAFQINDILGNRFYNFDGAGANAYAAIWFSGDQNTIVGNDSEGGKPLYEVYYDYQGSTLVQNNTIEDFYSETVATGLLTENTLFKLRFSGAFNIKSVQSTYRTKLFDLDNTGTASRLYVQDFSYQTISDTPFSATGAALYGISLSNTQRNLYILMTTPAKWSGNAVPATAIDYIGSDQNVNYLSANGAWYMDHGLNVTGEANFNNFLIANSTTYHNGLTYQVGNTHYFTNGGSLSHTRYGNSHTAFIHVDSSYQQALNTNYVALYTKWDKFGRWNFNGTDNSFTSPISYTFNGTDAMKPPAGTTAERPTGAAGYFRYNTDDNKAEYYNGSAWVQLAAATGMTNPMTTLGDVIYGGAAGAPTRLGGAAGFLKSTGAAAPAWSAIAEADVTNLTTDLSNKQPLDADLTTIAGLTATTDNFIVGVASAWASRTPAQVKTTLALNNVENTALSTWAGSTSITTLGTIATGTWNGTAIGSTYLPGTFSGFANPTASAGLTAVNGSATTAMRSDAAPAISQSIAPTWTGVHLFRQAGIAATSTDAAVLENNTAATNGAQEQRSPRLRLTAQGWKNNAPTSSQTVDWWVENVPVAASGSPTSNLNFISRINAGAANIRATLLSSGQLQLPAYTTTSSFGGTPVGQLNFDASGNVIPGAIGSGGMTNPMTTLGDIIYGGAAGTPTRLGGAAGFLKSTGAAAPTFSAIAQGDVTNLTSDLALLAPKASPFFTGLATHTRDALGATATPALDLVNNTAATAIATVQMPPGILYRGQGWKTTATAASQTVEFRQYMLPEVGTANPFGAMRWDANINGAGWTNLAYLHSVGTFVLPLGGITASGQSSITSANPQLQLKSDASNYLNAGANAAGVATFNAIGTGPYFEFLINSVSKAALDANNFIVSTGLVPNSTNTRSLGLSANRWATTYGVNLDYTGTVTFSGAGTPGAGKVFTSDGTGGGTWQGMTTVVSVTTTTYNATQTSGDIILLVDAATAGGNVTVNIPTAVGNTAKFTIKKIDAGSNTVTIDASGSQTIDGQLTQVIVLPNTSTSIVNNNANWFRI